jgi:hypothetical protein
VGFKPIDRTDRGTAHRAFNWDPGSRFLPPWPGSGRTKGAHWRLAVGGARSRMADGRGQAPGDPLGLGLGPGGSYAVLVSVLDGI